MRRFIFWQYDIFNVEIKQLRNELWIEVPRKMKEAKISPFKWHANVLNLYALYINQNVGYVLNKTRLFLSFRTASVKNINYESQYCLSSAKKLYC